MTQVVQLPAQVVNVGFKHDIDVGAGRGLLLEEFPLGLEHFVLLFQEAYLQTEKGRKKKSWVVKKKVFVCFIPVDQTEIAEWIDRDG